MTMRISRIQIDNYRSIQSISFQPKELALLIGQNNAGKSNVLRALNLVLGEPWPSERNFDETDFHNHDTNKPIEIRVFFDEIQEEWRNGAKCEIAGFLLRCRAYKRKTGSKLAGDLTVDYVCINEKGLEVTYPDEPFRKGVQFKGRMVPFRVTNDLRDRVPFIYIDVQRDYRRHSPSGRWAVLRRLLSTVQSKLKTSKDAIDDVDETGSAVKRTRLEAYRHRLNHAFEALRSADFEQVESTLEGHALELLGLQKSRDAVRLAFDPTDPENIFKSLQLYVREGIIEAAAEEVGAGLQSAIVVAIFRTYQELHRQDAIFAIEEPEVFLHPHRARFFSSTLCAVADGGNQVFLSTHSPLFVPMERFENIVLVRKTASGTTTQQTGAIHQALPGSKEYLRLINECDSQRSEMFFASRVMLVEGYTERVMFPLLFKVLEIDLNREGISVIECQGKTKIPLFAKILTSLQIPFIVVHDEDVIEIDDSWETEKKGKARDSNKQHRQWNSEIAAAVDDPKRLFVLSPNIESVCGLPKREDTKIQKAIEMFTDVVDYEVVPKPLQTIIESFLSLTEAKV
jgi:predicted ATP-dependent endonuclease of OLD family